MSKIRKRFFTCQKRDQAVCFRQAQRSLWICSLIFFAGNPATSADTFQPYESVEQVPDSVQELWKGFDPEAEALDTEIVKEWVKDGVTTRYLTFNVLNFQGTPSRIAAYYCFPNSPGPHPAFVWAHGGGQRAERQRGEYFARCGYATVDINWLGRPMEEGVSVNTDWGKLDPTQGPQYYPKALRKSWKRNFSSDAFTIDPVNSPRNCNWFLLAVAGRRAITFLTQQEEVDAERIGFAGYSMGGMITALTGIDKRLKALVPFVGGSGFKHIDFPGGIEGSSLLPHYRETVDLYANTMDASSYWPLVNAPVMFISSSNDFHSTFERVNQSMRLLPHDQWRVSTNQHRNHAPGPEQWVLLNLWFEHFLKGLPLRVPSRPAVSWTLSSESGEFVVNPASVEQLQSVEMYYSHDPNSRTRFWHHLPSESRFAGFQARVPIRKDLPTYVFAHLRYQLEEVIALERGETKTFGLNSEEVMFVPEQVDLAKLTELGVSTVVYDVGEGRAHGWTTRDGKTLNTYKFQSPRLIKENKSRLRVVIDSPVEDAVLRLSTSGKFLDRRIAQGEFRISKRLSGIGTHEIVIRREELMGDPSGDMDWAGVSTFEIALIDPNSRQGIPLMRDDKLVLLKKIELLD